MTDVQRYIAVGLPILLNGAMMIILMAYLNARIDGVNTKIDGLRNEIGAKFETQTQGLLRVEGVIDARLRHLDGA